MKSRGVRTDTAHRGYEGVVRGDRQQPPEVSHQLVNETWPSHAGYVVSAGSRYLASDRSQPEERFAVWVSVQQILHMLK